MAVMMALPASTAAQLPTEDAEAKFSGSHAAVPARFFIGHELAATEAPHPGFHP